MIKTKFRNRVDNNKISRHCSQLALRKSFLQNGISKDSDTSLHNIRKTTFWTKKVIGTMGIENLPPNQKQIQRADQTKNKQSFSMKVQTQVSQTNSIYPKHKQQAEVAEIVDSKLNCIQKSQKQIMREVNLIVQEQLPKLNICLQLFESAMKIFKLAYKNRDKAYSSQLEIITDNHLQISNLLFRKVLSHSKYFANVNKCANLIQKNIDLQKQNRKLLDAITSLESQGSQKRIIRKHHQANLQCFKIKQIDYQNILTENYVMETKVVSQQKINSLCHSLLNPFLNTQNFNKKIGQFELSSRILGSLLKSNQGLMILRKYANQRKERYTTKIQQSFSKSFIYAILDFKIEIDILNLVKQNINRYSIKGFFDICDDKINLKYAIMLLNKFSFLNDNEKIKQIIIKLLQKITLSDQRKFSGIQIIQIQKYIDQNHSQTNCLSIGFLSSDVPSLKNVVNKIPDYGHFCRNKRSKTALGQRKISSISNFQRRIQQHLNLDTSLLNKFEITRSEVTLLTYFFIVYQFQFVRKNCLTLFKIMDCDTIELKIQKTLQKTLNKRIVDKIQNMDKAQKQSIFQLSQIMIKSYQIETIFADKHRQASVMEYLNMVNKQIIQILQHQNKQLVLFDILNDNNKVSESSNIALY